MTLNDIEREAAELAKTITTMRAQGEQHSGKLSGLEERMVAGEAAIARLNQAVDAYRQASFERSYNGGSNRELDRYTRASDEEISSPETKRCYATNKDARNAIRLVGHERMGDKADPRSVYRVWGLFDDPQPRTEWQRRAQELLDRRNLIKAVLNSGRGHGEPVRRAYRCEAELLDHLRTGPDHIAKIFSDVSGAGAEWLPDNPMPELERQIMFRPSRWQMFQQIQMQRNPLLRPFKSGFLRAYKGQVPASDDPAADPTLSTFTTDTNAVIAAEEVAVGAQVHQNAEEDALISFELEIRGDISDATIFAIENAITNGDSAASHQDAIASWNTRGRLGSTGLGLANDQRRLWLGHRPLAYDLTSMTTDAGGAAVTAAHLLADLNKLGMESLLNADGQIRAVIEVSPETFFGYLVDLDEFDAFDNVGVLASVLTGQLGDLSRTPGGLLPGQVGFLYGRFPVLVNYLITKDLAATGLYTGSGATTGVLTYDAARFQMFIRRGSMVQVADDIRNNTRTLVSRARMKFQPKDAVSSTNKTVHWRFNTT